MSRTGETIGRTRRLLVAFAIIALISAGCANAPAETGPGSSNGNTTPAQAIVPLTDPSATGPGSSNGNTTPAQVIIPPPEPSATGPASSGGNTTPAQAIVPPPEPSATGPTSSSGGNTTAASHDLPRSEHRGAPGEADGVVPDGTTVFDDELPGVANLDPALLGALRQAATDAADDGVEFFVNSGWRSPEYQNQLLREAVATYGSEEEAARWVATADTSPHVSGDAVDLSPLNATAWLSEHGTRYGLCQIYRNEPWHYELRPDAIDHDCPPMYDDPTHDPRMQP